MLVKGEFKELLKEIITVSNQNAIDGDQIDTAIDTYTQKFEDLIYKTIKEITIVIPPGVIQVIGSAASQTNPIQIVLTDVIN